MKPLSLLLFLGWVTCIRSDSNGSSSELFSIAPPSYLVLAQRALTDQADDALHLTNRVYVASRMVSAPSTTSLTSPSGSSAVTANGNITISRPTGYSTSFGNTLASFGVSGNGTAPVQNNQWQVSSYESSQPLRLTINGSEPIGSSSSLSVDITQNLTTSGSTDTPILNIPDTGEGSYAVDRLSNVFAASSVVRKAANP